MARLILIIIFIQQSLIQYLQANGSQAAGDPIVSFVEQSRKKILEVHIPYFVVDIGIIDTMMQDLYTHGIR